MWVAPLLSEKSRNSKSKKNYQNYNKEGYNFRKRSAMSRHSPVSPIAASDNFFKDHDSPSTSTSKEVNFHDELPSSTLRIKEPPTHDTSKSPLNQRNLKNSLNSTLPCIDDCNISSELNHNIPNDVTSNNEESAEKINGEADQMDGKLLNKEEKNEDEDDMCVKCLYFGIQCCECTIM